MDGVGGVVGPGPASRGAHGASARRKSPRGPRSGIDGKATDILFHPPPFEIPPRMFQEMCATPLKAARARAVATRMSQPVERMRQACRKMRASSTPGIGLVMGRQIIRQSGWGGRGRACRGVLATSSPLDAAPGMRLFEGGDPFRRHAGLGDIHQFEPGQGRQHGQAGIRHPGPGQSQFGELGQGRHRP